MFADCGVSLQANEIAAKPILRSFCANESTSIAGRQISKCGGPCWAANSHNRQLIEHDHILSLLLRLVFPRARSAYTSYGT